MIYFIIISNLIFLRNIINISIIFFYLYENYEKINYINEYLFFLIKENREFKFD